MMIQKNIFNRVCPRCCNLCSDQTFLDQSNGWHYLCNRFECSSCKYSFETALEEFSAIVSESDDSLCEVVNSDNFAVKLIANNIAMKHLTANGLGEYPLSKAEKFTNKFDEMILESCLSTCSAEYLPIYYLIAAIELEEKCKPCQAEIAMDCFRGYFDAGFDYSFEEILEIASEESIAEKAREWLGEFGFAALADKTIHH